MFTYCSPSNLHSGLEAGSDDLTSVQTKMQDSEKLLSQLMSKPKHTSMGVHKGCLCPVASSSHFPACLLSAYLSLIPLSSIYYAFV